MLKDIEEERLKLQEERARCEIAKTLQSKNADDTGRSRAEIDAAVKYAEVNKNYFSLRRFFEVNSMGNIRNLFNGFFIFRFLNIKLGFVYNVS